MSTLIQMGVDCRICSDTTQIACTVEQLTEVYLPRTQRRLMQEIFPDLSIGDRELLISGTCDTCWQNLHGRDDEEAN